MKKGHRRDAFERGGHGRGMQNRMSKTAKRNMDRIVDKRRRRAHKAEDLAKLCTSSLPPASTYTSSTGWPLWLQATLWSN